jgi:ankyrin repeat protein
LLHRKRRYLQALGIVVISTLLLLACLLFRKRQDYFVAAVKANNPTLIRALAVIGANPDTPYREDSDYGDNSAYPPLVIQLSQYYNADQQHRPQYENTLNALLDSGANPNIVLGTGVRPLHMVAADNHLTIAASFIAHGADVNAKDKSGVTPLMYASGAGNFNMVALLLKNKAEVDARANRGVTALMAAATTNRVAVARLLIENGADPDLKDYRGWSVSYHARHRPEIQSLLKEIKRDNSNR